ncbi:MAG TPA: IS21 family transposase, partial [Myxococcota bacterium]|nr:IS21 family transposase [Myxococcota bacterium]
MKKLIKERGKGANQSVAAARSGMSRQTAAKYIKLGKLPSELKEPRTYLTRGNPFESDWKEVEQMLAHTPDLQAKTIFQVLSERNPSRYEPGQLRTLQRHIKRWRALQGDDRAQEVFFPQQHLPGEAMQGDFTHTGELGLTLAGVEYKPLLCHVVLPYSGWQWATPCRSESLLALRTGVQDAVFRLGMVPEWFQTDNSTGATHRIGDGSRRFHADYVELMSHLGMKPRTTAVGKKEQNGSVEAHNGAFKRL